jgi:hypothetical protein
MKPSFRTWVAVAAVGVAGCAHHPARVASPAPAPGSSPVQPGAPAPLPVPADPDEAFHGVRFGASRLDVLHAYPGAACGPQQCTGETRLFGLPATFLVFAQADGRWVARVSVPESTAPGANFNHVNDGLSARFHQQEVVIEQGGNLYRWHLEAHRPRQAVLRRCPSDQRCAGLEHNVVEVDFFEQDAPLAHAW